MDRQISYKLERARRSLKEAGWSRCTELSMVPSPWALGYRGRIRLRFDEQGLCSFFNPDKQQDCPVLHPELRSCLARLRARAAQEPRGFGWFSHVEVRRPDLAGRPSAYFVARPDAPVSSDGHLSALLDEPWLFACEQDQATLPCQRYALAGSFIDVPLGSFLQINSEVNELLIAHLVDGARHRGLSSFCDLYAGCGNFSLPLAAAGLTGDAIELDPRAAAAGARTAQLRDLSGLSFACGDARAHCQRAEGANRRYDLVIADPPRAGLGGAAWSLAAVTGGWLVLLCCSWSRLTRDVSALAGAGFEVRAVTLFDMFPHTEQVESVVWLERRRD